MGLLDDAIREHLELKRRRGADPGEIERAEREALGPVRRMPEEVVPDDLGEIEANFVPESPVAYDQEEYRDEDEVFEEDESLPGEAHRLDQVGRPYGFEEPLDDDLYDHEPAHADEAPMIRPDPPPRDPELHDLRPAVPGDETVEYRLEDEPLEHERPQDVLGETPDFLHETPDHDRLWFEQRPPRDFDFDD